MSPVDSKGNKKSFKKYFNIKTNVVSRKKVNFSWIIKIVLWTFAISITLSTISNKALSNINLFFAVLILLLIIFVGIIFDIVGLAVAAADEKPFHSMASRRVKGANTAIKLIRNSEKVSSFCNDVIGDIASIISGSTGVVIVAAFMQNFNNINETIVALIVTGLISSVMVGGKAIGKTIALNRSNSIVFALSILISFIFHEKKADK